MEKGKAKRGPRKPQGTTPTQDEILNMVVVQKQVDAELDQIDDSEAFASWTKNCTVTTPDSFSTMPTPIDHLSVSNSPFHRPTTPVIYEMLENEGKIQIPDFDALKHRRKNLAATVKSIAIEQQQDMIVKNVRTAQSIKIPISIPAPQGGIMNREKVSEHLRNMFAPVNHLFIKLDGTQKPTTILSAHQSELILARNSKLWAKNKEQTFLAVKTIADSTYNGLFNTDPPDSFYSEFLTNPKHVSHPDEEWKILTKFGGLELRVRALL